MAKDVRSYRKEIDGTTYTTEDFPAGEAVDLGVEVMSLLPEQELHLLISLVVNAMGDEEAQATAQEVAAESGHIFAAALQKVLSAARERPGGTSGLLRRILSRTTADKCILLDPACPVAGGNVGEAFDTHFRGRLGHLRRVVQWLWVTLFLQPLLGDLFATALGDRERADPTKASEPNVSPG